jgi:hypothetical protein
LETPHDTRVGLQVPYLVRIHVIYGEKLWIIIFIFLLSIIFKNAKSMHWTIRVFLVRTLTRSNVHHAVTNSHASVGVFN